MRADLEVAQREKERNDLLCEMQSHAFLYGPEGEADSWYRKKKGKEYVEVNALLDFLRTAERTRNEHRRLPESLRD